MALAKYFVPFISGGPGAWAWAWGMGWAWAWGVGWGWGWGWLLKEAEIYDK